MDSLTIEDMKEALINVSRSIVANEKLLTEMDTIIGDGDHGIGMKEGFSALELFLNSQEFDDMEELLSDSGIELLKAMGGASGVIFGTMFIGGRKIVEGKTEINANDLIQFFDESAKAIMRRGGAKPGDKTMLDALLPAIEYMKDARKNTTNVPTILERAAVGAKVGVEASKQMLPQTGRSKNFREKALGYPDPGAVSVSIIFTSLAESVSKIE